MSVAAEGRWRRFVSAPNSCEAPLRMAALGIAAGLAGALLVTRVLKTFLYGLEPTDRITFCLVCAILGAAAFLASYLPARRAASVDPMAALRRE